MTILGIAGWPPSRLGVDMANELFKPYAKETYGYDVNFSFEEAPFESLFQKAATSLQSGSDQYNIIISDSQWLGALAEPGWIVRLNDIIAENPELDIQFEEAAAIGYRIYPDGSDNIYGFPQEGDTIALFVRQDLMSDQAERDAYMAANDGEDLPQTYDEWLEGRHRPLRAHLPALHAAGRQPLRHGVPVVEGLRLRLLLRLPVHVLQRRRGLGSGDRSGRRHRSTPRSTSPAWSTTSVSSSTPLPVPTNYGIAEEVDVFTAGTIATCWQWAALGPQMLNQIAGGEPGEVADEAKPVTPDMVLITRHRDSRRRTAR